MFLSPALQTLKRPSKSLCKLVMFTLQLLHETWVSDILACADYLWHYLPIRNLADKFWAKVQERISGFQLAVWVLSYLIFKCMCFEYLSLLFQTNWVEVVIKQVTCTKILMNWLAWICFSSSIEDSLILTTDWMSIKPHNINSLDDPLSYSKWIYVKHFTICWK